MQVATKSMAMPGFYASGIDNLFQNTYEMHHASWSIVSSSTSTAIQLNFGKAITLIVFIW